MVTEFLRTYMTSIVEIQSVPLKYMDTWTNVTWTNVAWTTVAGTVVTMHKGI